MPISREEVRKIAHLARLEIENEKLEGFVDQFERILDHFTSLQKVDTTSVEGAIHVPASESGTPLREDRVEKSLAVEEVLSGAPDSSEGQFRVPRVIE